ncbi:MAG: glycosyltransferase family 9 protein, partial [Nitrospira sp.]|nr:glycosyltransferase family 9 protein [Nitrospira sp.]
VYRSVGGRCPVKNAAGQTTIEQAAALLAECRLLLTNDTGPMHLAVAVGTPVVDLSVGHVDFRETGPYGPGHWVFQPDLECAPCGFDQICAHHACKDRLPPEQVAELLLHVLGRRSFPSEVTGYRVYQSGIDEDQLGMFVRRAGYESAETLWYAAFWRRYWFETFTGAASNVPAPEGMPPHAGEAMALLKELAPAVDRACTRAQQIVQAAARRPVDVASLQTLQRTQSQERESLARMGMSTLMTNPVTTAFLRTIQNDNVQGVKELAQYHAWAYRQWYAQLTHLIHALELCDQGATRRLTMLPTSKQACAG